MPTCTAKLNELRTDFGEDCKMMFASEGGIVFGRTPEQRGLHSVSVADLHFKFEDTPDVALERVRIAKLIRDLTKKKRRE